MNKKGTFLLSIFCLWICGCSTYPSGHPEISPGLPAMPDRPIERSPYYSELMETYGKGMRYERAKIGYLLNEIERAPFTFIRHGREYDNKTTASHLREKYYERLREVRTARDFINKVGTRSSVSGRTYWVKDGRGRIYRSKDLLLYELRRLELFMDRKKKKEVPIQETERSAP